MTTFVAKNKMSKKAQKALNAQRRVTWDFSPVTKTVDSKKIYNRKRARHRSQYDDGFLLFIYDFCLLLQSEYSTSHGILA